MAPKPRRVELDIFGQTFSLIAEDEARLQEVARHVDAEMKQLSQSTATIDSFRLAVLAALNIANERFDLADRLARKDNAVQAQFEALSAKAARITLALDEALGPQTAGSTPVER
jgi:cell division protein ZapA